MVMFACKLCGKTYEGVPVLAPEALPEEVERRRQVWLTADDKLAKAPDNEHFEKAQRKAWFEYMATKSSGVETVPDALVTKKDKAGFYLACAEPCGSV